MKGNWVLLCAQSGLNGVKHGIHLGTPRGIQTTVANTFIFPVDGVWSGWAWSPCTVMCGGGTTTGQRTCTAPVNGGADCSGPAEETQICGTRSCGEGKNGYIKLNLWQISLLVC
jgi:hypothetical protein